MFLFYVVHLLILLSIHKNTFKKDCISYQLAGSFRFFRRLVAIDFFDDKEKYYYLLFLMLVLVLITCVLFCRTLVGFPSASSLGSRWKLSRKVQPTWSTVPWTVLATMEEKRIGKILLSAWLERRWRGGTS